RRSRAVQSFTAERKVEVAVGVGLLVLVIGGIAVIRSRRRALAAMLGGAARSPRSATAATRAYGRTLRRLARRGHRKRAPETPQEHALALVRAGVPGAQKLVELVALHYASEYATDLDDDTPPSEPGDLAARAEALEGEISRALADARRARRARPAR